MLGYVLDFVCRVVWKWYLNFQWDVNGQKGGRNRGIGIVELVIPNVIVG